MAVKNIIRLISILSIFVVPIFSFAHGTSYLEYNPDNSKSLKDANVATPSQVFFAQNDFISGFDLWLANPGSSGTATFELLNEQGTVLTSKTVTIPTISLTSNGTKFYVDLNFQLPVLADSKYTLRIISSMPELRLYYSDRVQVVSHNAPFASEYTIGVAKLGTEDQIFSFKYALYEVTETSAPIIYNVGWTVISSNQMQVDFNTNEAVDYRIEYGPASPPAGGYTQSTSFLGGYEFCTQGISVCSIIIPVSSNTTYDYRLTVKDVWGNQSQTTGTFTSGQSQTPIPTPTSTNVPPIISNLRIVEVTNNSVSVAWTTNEISNSRLRIVLSGFITIITESDTTLELEHYLEINEGLSPNTDYLAEVTSVDLENLGSIASISFTTLSAVPTQSPSPTPTTSPVPSPTASPITSPTSSPTPLLSSVPSATPIQQGVTISSVSNGSSTVEWAVPQNGESQDGYRVDIFDQWGNLKESIYVTSGEHKINVSGLNDDEEYTVIVYENDGGVFKKIDKPVKTEVKEDTILDRLLRFWWIFIPLLAGLGYIVWRNYIKNKSEILNPKS